MRQLKDCIVVWMGNSPYEQALALQMRICECKKAGFETDILLLLEHPPTITLGRNASAKHLLVAEEDLRSRGIGLYHVDRGGDITFHGPGQLVGYPLLALSPWERDVHEYMRKLEESLIHLLHSYQITAHRDVRYTGVWTEKGKIAAMGVHISRWITRHGFALNVNTDLNYYNLIVPCGLVGKGVTSMREELGSPLDLEEVAQRYACAFAPIFERKTIPMTLNKLLQTLSDFGLQKTVEIGAGEGGVCGDSH